MAFTGITATEAEIDQKSGKYASTDYTDTMKTQALLQAESFLNMETLINWSDWYATAPNVDFKYTVTNFTSCFVAIEAINYKIDEHPGLAYAQLKLDVLRDTMMRALATLKRKEVQTFIGII